MRSQADAEPHRSGFARLDRWWGVVFAAFTALFACVAVTLALNKPFWHDEIYTILFADLPSLGTMWRAAHDGIDLAPPFNAMLTHGVHALTGVGPLSTRLPALVGYWTMSLVVFDLVRRRSHVVAAVSAAILPCLTEAFRYAIEARGYGAMLGLFALAVWAWSEAARDRNRALMLPLLALALAAGLWNQYFAVLALVPIGIGEALRLFRRRAVDWRVSAAIGAGVAGAWPLRGLMRVAASHASTYWRHARVSDIGPTFLFLFEPLLTTPVIVASALALLFVVASAIQRQRAAVQADYSHLPAYEVGAGLGALAVPAAAVLLGVYGAGAFAPRYALAGVMGMSVVLPLAIARAGSRRGAADMLLATALVATFCGSAYRALVTERQSYRDPMDARPLLVEQLRQGETVVVSGPTEYLQLWYYAPVELRSQLVYLADPIAALHGLGSDTVDRNYLALRRSSSVPVFEYDHFMASHRSFQVYEVGRGWLLERLKASGAAFDEIGREADGPLYRVRMPPPSSGRGSAPSRCAPPRRPSSRC
jgi:hypothetical protein